MSNVPTSLPASTLEPDACHAMELYRVDGAPVESALLGDDEPLKLTSDKEVSVDTAHPDCAVALMSRIALSISLWATG